MPFTHIDDKMTARFMEPDDNDRRLSQARHPSSRGKTRSVDIATPYKALTAPLDASWPRATVRPMPRLDGKGIVWAVKLWAAQGVSLIERGLWVTTASAELSHAMDWADVEVGYRRPDIRRPARQETPC